MNIATKAPLPDTPGWSILVVDDEPQIRSFLEISLKAQGYRVLCSATGQAAIDDFRGQQSDLVILDLGLPDMDGLVVLQRLRAFSTVPVIVLTARADELQKVALLDAGANDYVTKPFGIQELMARIRSVLRTTRKDEAEFLFDDGHLVIDRHALNVSIGGEPVALTKKERAVLWLLAKEGGGLVTHSRLLSEVWGPTHEEDLHYLRVLIARVRRKLGDDALNPRYLVTEPGLGMRFGVQQM